MGRLQLFKIEYEVGLDAIRWKARIVAYSSEQAISFIKKCIGTNNINVFSVESIEDVDGISNEVVDKILEKYKEANKIETVENKLKNIKPNKEDALILPKNKKGMSKRKEK